ncbi:MAG: SprT family zinc-dependent metalloprotease [Alphaproteobacteria bacterium]
MIKSSSPLTLLKHVLANGRTLPVYLRPNKRMKNIRVRLHPRHDAVIISTHPRVPIDYVHHFLEGAKEWIEKSTQKRSLRTLFAPGLQISALGKMMMLEHCESSKRHSSGSYVSCTETNIIVCGAISEFNIRIKKFLKHLVLEEVKKQSLAYANLLGFPINKISLRDNTSCWGSCSGKGNLSFNWRIALAPSAALSYLCAHEVAHLKHKDHSANFWETVESLYPDYKASRAWLKEHGTKLLSYG